MATLGADMARLSSRAGAAEVVVGGWAGAGAGAGAGSSLRLSFWRFPGKHIRR